MQITILGFVLGLLLLAIPVYMVSALKLNMMRRLLATYGWMAALSVLLSVVLWSAITLRQLWLTLLASVILIVVGTATIAGKSLVSFERLFVPLLAGMFAGVVVVGLYVSFLVFGVKNPFVPHIFLPVVSLLVGSAVGVNLKALNTYFSGLSLHNQLYEYLLGNGATHRQAVDYFARRCFQAALVPVLRHMSGLVWSTAQVLLIAMVLSGTPVWTALAVELLYPLLVVGTSFVSLAVTLWLGRHYLFDDYERLRMKRASQASAAAPSVQQPAPERYGDAEGEYMPHEQQPNG